MSDATYDETRQEMQRDLERAKRESAELAGVARERGREQLEGAKREAADRAEQIADAVEATASQLEQQDGGQMISGYGHSLATMMRQLAGGIRERDVDEFARELTTFARQHPAAFLAGSVALGFGISRFLKASSHRPHDDDYEYYASDDDTEFDSDYEREYTGDPFMGTQTGDGAGLGTQTGGAEAGDSPDDIAGLGTETPSRDRTAHDTTLRTGGTP